MQCSPSNVRLRQNFSFKKKPHDRTIAGACFESIVPAFNDYFLGVTRILFFERSVKP